MQHIAQISASKSIYYNLKQYFLLRKYFLRDELYSNRSYLIRHYKSFYIRDKSNRKFNQKLLSIQVDIEYIFVILKSWWKSLTRLKLIIWSKEKYKFAVKWITACYVLYIIFIRLKDNWDKKKSWWIEKKISKHN